MKIVQEQMLFDCLAQFESGVSVEALMAKYPHAAAEIEKFLAVAAQLQQVKVQPSLAAKWQSQKLFLQQAAEMRAAGRRGWFSWRGVQRTLLPLASLAVVTILLGATLLFASTAALPGDVLYDTKRWLETVQVQQATDATAVFSLKSQQNEERIRETKSLLRTQETAVVSFEGRLNAKQGSNWVIGGLAVQVTAQTQVAAGAEVGALLLVNGRTQNGQLFASQITVLQAISGTTTPSPQAAGSVTPTAMPTQSAPTGTITATASPTKTATPTITATPGATGEPTQAVSPTATLTATPKATATPDATVPPTAVPPTPTSPPPNTPPAGNDNNNDNDNDNADDDGNNNGDNNNNSNDNANDNDDDDDGDNSGSGDNDNDNDDDNDDDD